MSTRERADRQLAWELHVELATRVSVVPLAAGEGLLVEAVRSLDTLAARCRDLLSGHPPHPVGPDGDACEVEAVGRTVLGDVLDPMLARWRSAVSARNATLPSGVGPADHERAWPRADALRADLAHARLRLTASAEQLAELAGTASLVPPGVTAAPPGPADVSRHPAPGGSPADPPGAGRNPREGGR